MRELRSRTPVVLEVSSLVGGCGCRPARFAHEDRGGEDSFVFAMRDLRRDDKCGVIHKPCFFVTMAEDERYRCGSEVFISWTNELLHSFLTLLTGGHHHSLCKCNDKSINKAHKNPVCKSLARLWFHYRGETRGVDAKGDETKLGIIIRHQF